MRAVSLRQPLPRYVEPGFHWRCSAHRNDDTVTLTMAGGGWERFCRRCRRAETVAVFCAKFVCWPAVRRGRPLRWKKTAPTCCHKTPRTPDAQQVVKSCHRRGTASVSAKTNSVLIFQCHWRWFCTEGRYHAGHRGKLHSCCTMQGSSFRPFFQTARSLPPEFTPRSREEFKVGCERSAAAIQEKIKSPHNIFGLSGPPFCRMAAAAPAASRSCDVGRQLG